MKRGQSTLEYLVTYGWTFAAIVAVIGVLWYMGIFNPTTLVGTSENARGFTFNLLGQKYSDTQLTLAIGNTQGQLVNITAVKVDNHAGVLAPTSINPGASATLTITSVPSCGATGGRYFSIPVEITYQTSGGVANKKDSGTITGTCS